MKYLTIVYYTLTISISILILFNISQHIIHVSFAQSTPPTSSNYKVLEYGFGGGGTASSASNMYSIFGTLGQVDQGSPSSQHYFVGAGLEYEITATEAAAPTFTNPGSYYNKLHVVVNRGGNNPTDYEYAIALSASDTAHFKYLAADHTLTSTLTDSNWQKYSVWGSSTGIDIIDLIPGTTYYARVSTRQGKFFTQSPWSPISTAATINPTLSFDIDVSPSDTETSAPYILNIGNLSPGTVTASNDRVWIDLDTNGNTGGFISVSDSNTGLLSSTASYTISSSTNDLTAQQTGYGAQAFSSSQTSGGPMEALVPYNSATNTNNVGILDTTKRYIFDSSQSPVVGGRVSFKIKAKASSTTPSAGDYSDVLTILATGSF